MPIYEFKCRDCQAVTEVLFRSGSDDLGLRCSQCGSEDLEKILSSPSMVSSGKSRAPGKTCCGREERCDVPPCSTGGTCRKD